MVEYRDMTFCSFYEDCLEGENCMRALTPQVRQDAERWAREIGLKETPICVFLEKPECFKEK